MNPHRPNSGVSDEMLHENVILCCGEDFTELIQCFSESSLGIRHEYRCYRFLRFENFTLIWTGIGTGCLEPLLFEIFDVPIIKKIVLVGTAGAFQSTASMGNFFWIAQAYLG